MNILITHAYAKENKGDAAILSVLIRQLKNAFPGAILTTAMYAKTEPQDTFDGVRLISNSMYHSVYKYHSLIMKLLNTAYMEGALLFWALCFYLFHISFTFLLPKAVREIAHEYLTADLVVPIGGGYFRAKKGFAENVNLLLLLNPVIVCLFLRKPIILYTQSIGPFATTFQGWATKIVLNRCNLILVREDHTIHTLDRIGVKKELVVRTVDSGFLFEAPHKYTIESFIENKEILKGKKLVGVTVRQWLDEKGQTQFEEAIAAFLAGFKDRQDLLFVFIPQVTAMLHGDDDRKVGTRIVSRIPEQTNVVNLTGVYDHYKLKDLYSSLDYLVGTRFHSVIFSITARVPAVAIEYEYKTSGIMKDLGLSKWVIPIEKVTKDNVTERFIALMDQKSQYLAILDAALPPYFAEAENVESKLKIAYESFHKNL